MIYSSLSTMENLQVFLSSEPYNITILSDVPRSTIPSIISTSEALIQAGSDILPDITNQNEQLEITQSSLFISDEDLKLSSTIKNQERESPTNIALSTGYNEIELSYFRKHVMR